MKRHSLDSRSRLRVRHLPTLLKRFSQVRVLVIGDLMLDHYIRGKVDRISPEAPVPVVQVTQESVHAGGAGNVVANVCALGGKVFTCGVIGRDHNGHLLRKKLTDLGAETLGIMTSQTTITTSKTRILAHNQQVVRLDREEQEALDSRITAKLRRFVQQHVKNFDVVVISDYGKGVVDAELLGLLASLQQQYGFSYLIDPKRRNYAYYRGATLVKPNKDEAGVAAGIDIRNETDLCQAGMRLLDLWKTEAVLVSRGEEGMSLFKRTSEPQHFPTMAREVFDVTGAGDTVLATCALALGAGTTLEVATILANHAAGLVVGKIGTATISPAELQFALQEE
ncbi:MAG: D-glycero-beta-D-manno-heptose-7-phosphate kinase [Candidatus Binatia bacterium]